jgi:hypothetical protein
MALKLRIGTTRYSLHLTRGTEGLQLSKLAFSPPLATKLQVYKKTPSQISNLATPTEPPRCLLFLGLTAIAAATVALAWRARLTVNQPFSTSATGQLLSILSDVRNLGPRTPTTPLETKLPAELRMIIHGHILRFQDPLRHVKSSYRKRKDHLALLAVNKLIHLEAIKVPYEQNTFIFSNDKLPFNTTGVLLKLDSLREYHHVIIE